jgi:hypothetical protein
VGDDFEITKVTRRAAGPGRWVRGRLNGYRFEALVFPDHAEDRDWEIGDSRISKLWVQRIYDRQTVYSWDRGADVPATTIPFRGLSISSALDWPISSTSKPKRGCSPRRPTLAGRA